MKTKILPIVTLISAAIFVAICYTSCGKHTDCPEFLYTGQNPILYLKINNNLNKNLLDPTTTGHYDTAMIKKLNGDNAQLSRPGALPVSFIFRWTTADIGTKIISLTATDQDTLVFVKTVNTQGCNLYNQLNGVKYNGVALTDTGGLYIAHK
jgi:hypothetical protein